MVSKRWFEFSLESKFRHPILTSILPQFYLCFTSSLPNFNLFFYLNLTSAQPAISNRGLETTVYKPLDMLHLPFRDLPCRSVREAAGTSKFGSVEGKGC